MPASALSGTMQRFILDIVICASLLIIATFIFAGSAYLSERNRSIKLQALSSTDPLTKVINRRALNTRMDSFISENPIPLRCSYIFLDIDFFKEVNDTYGHDMGDKVLCMVADILKNEFEDVGIVSRVGGDEFNIFVYEPISKEKLNKLMERIRLKFDTIHQELGQTMPIHFSAGIAAFPDNAENIRALAALADKALYYTKQHGRNGYCWYDDIDNKAE
jgi:diguanylate cyclase (GGDEF)-like protein